MKTPRLLLPAENEMLEAAFYYERQSQGLGADFLAKVQDAIEEIAQHPTRWPKREETFAGAWSIGSRLLFYTRNSAIRS